MVKVKTKKFKFPKNPSDFIYKEEVLHYIIELEATDSLDDLPENLLLYYALDTLINEVNNGGFSQYLTNHSGVGFPYIERAAQRVENAQVADLLNRFAEETKRYLGETKVTDIEISDEFDVILSELDDQFFKLDKKFGIEKLNRKAYKDNYTDGVIVIPLIKERESERCRYIIADPNVTTDAALISLCEYISEYADSNWDVEFSFWIGGAVFEKEFQLRLWSDIPRFDMCEIVKNFNHPEIMKFKEMEIFVVVEDTDYCTTQDVVRIKPSGFEKNEYVIKISKHSAWPKQSTSDTAPPIRIYFDLPYKDYDMEEIKQILLSLAPKYPSIKSVFTTQHNIRGSFKTEKLIHYER